MITPAQIKAARKLLGWSQMTLALEAGVAATRIGSLERAKKVPRKRPWRRFKARLSAQGFYLP
jgi:transcriptional regulator with XRE-family HTH domain